VHIIVDWNYGMNDSELKKVYAYKSYAILFSITLYFMIALEYINCIHVLYPRI
jgi:hypothetical protein